MMFYGAYKKSTGEINGGFYGGTEGYRLWHEETFSPDIEVLALIDLTVHGKTYAERKENVRNKAIDFQNLFAQSVPMYWSEVADWSEYFETQGKRYGLLREFHENAIC